MKKNILLIDADADSVEAVRQAAAQTGFAVRVATKSSEAFEILHCGFAQIDLVFLDLDSGVNGTALLEAMWGCERRPAVVVLAGAGAGYLKRVAANHGAECVTKPLTVDKLILAIEEVERNRQASRGCSCDAWGHVNERSLVRPARSNSEASLK